ncbi:MAG: hypothetical protein Q8R13_01475 [bacterium]|nr:hypothetical protein [bacterium]
MEFHQKKQFLIGGIGATLFFLIFGVIFGGRIYGYFFTPPEEAVDAPAIDLLWVKAFPGEGDGVWDAAARIRNPDAARGVRRAGYEFALLDAGGTVLAVRTGEAFLRRDEAKYVVENSIESSIEPARVRFTLREATWVEDAEAADGPFILQRHTLTRGELSGVVLNDTALGFGTVHVAAVLFDADRDPIRARRTSFARMTAREERAFTLRWSNSGAATAAEIEISTNLFDATNYLPQEPESNF